MADPSLVPYRSSELHVLVADFLASCRARGLSSRTVESGYGYPLRSVFLPWCDQHDITQVEQLNQRVLDRFTSGLLDHGGRSGRPLSKYSVHAYARAVRLLLTWARREGEQVSGLPQLPKLPRRIVEVLSRDEIRAMEDAASSERDKLILRVLADCGLRVGELVMLTSDDILRRDREAFLRIRGKGDKHRLVPVAPSTVRRIERYVRSGRPRETNSERLFLSLRRGPTNTYEPITRSGILQLVHLLAQRAGIRHRVHPHVLRHSWVTEMLRRGVNPKIVADVAGHSSLRMLESVYAHLSASDAYTAMIRILTEG
jgi:integrase/recombinase XerD